ncbi:hypothetical protein KC865_02350 [Candidatus Kaiserbacteria bacterium]|nr:hypothetical protein [Candidatus Kaiserbacteria bacterium]USN91804.1 MAG: hypothetical protein H6782_02940 [Candidatus Nomurabacteria bacterium]
MTVSICGVLVYEEASDSDLRSLLKEIGRNGEMERGEDIRKIIESILDRRSESKISNDIVS